MQNKTILCQLEHAKIPPHPEHTHIRNQCLFMEAAYTNLLAGRQDDMSDMPSQQPTEQPRTSPPGSSVAQHMPRRLSCVCLPECSVSRAMATGALEAFKVVEVIRLAALAVSYFTDQPTPWFRRWEHEKWCTWWRSVGRELSVGRLAGCRCPSSPSRR